METKNKKAVYIIIILAVIGFAVWHYQNVQEPKDSALDTATSTPNSNNTSTHIGVGDAGIEFEQGGENAVVTVTRVPQPLPKLIMPTNFNPNLSGSIRDTLNKNIKDLNDKLTTDPSQYNNWISLGMQWKIVGDNEQVRNYWEYARKLSPGSETALINLGDLYAYYLKDNKLAEERFLEALKVAPAQLDVYLRLVDFYRDVTKETAKAKDMVEKGLERFPENPDLLKYKAMLNK